MRRAKLAVSIALGGLLVLAAAAVWTWRNSGQPGPWPEPGDFEAAPVLSEAELRSRVLDENPGLADAIEAGDQLATVRQLRGWAAGVMDLNKGNADYWLKLERSQRSLGNMLWLFDENLLGVQCGQGSRFLAKVYQLFGFDAVYYNSGVYFTEPELKPLNEGKTHVITLVEIEHEGQTKWLAQDILFDSEYRLRGEEASDFAALLARLREQPDGVAERVTDSRPIERDFNRIAKEAVTSSADFSELRGQIESWRDTDRFKTGWASWIPQDSTSARLIREELGFEGRVEPFHLFLFPIGRNRGVVGLDGLVSMQAAYKSRPDVAAKGP